MKNTTPSDKLKRLSKELQEDGYTLLDENDSSCITLLKGKTTVKIK